VGRTFLLVASAAIVFAGGLYVSLERPAWVSGVAGASGPSPVLVVLVGSASGVRELRAAVAAERIVVEGRRAFALAEGRIVAVDAEAANAPLAAAGWGDRPIEIVALARPGPGAGKAAPRRRGGEAGGGSSEIAALLQRDELSPREALAALRALEAGGGP
jgi:hypothetical protein